jgi:RNA polymerase sigma factor (sigma-70 family)
MINRSLKIGVSRTNPRLHPDDSVLVTLADEELVARAQREGCCASQRVLLVRHLPSFQWLAARRARKLRFSREDVEGARQEIFFALRQTIRQYDLAQLTGPRPCRYRTFAFLVVGRRLRDLLAKIRRVRRRYVHVPDLEEIHWRQKAPEAEGNGILLLSARGVQDPARLAEWREQSTRLDQALDELDTTDRAICDALARGITLKTVAEQLGIPYRTLKFRWRELKERLRTQLN